MIAVGAVPTFNNTNRLTDVFGQGNGTTYTIPEFALSKDQVSWQVELYGGRFNGAGKAGEVYDYSHNVHGYVNGVRANNPTSFYLLRGIDHRIVYTARNSDRLCAQFIQHVYADEATTLLSDRYQNFYDETRVGGDLSVNEAKNGFILQSDGTKASGVYTNSLNVGYQAKFLRFMVYNAGETTATFKVNNGMEFTIAPKGYALFNPDSFGYQAAVVGWKMVSQNSELLPLTFTATSATAGLELYLSRFGVNEGAFEAPTLEAPVYEEFYEQDTSLTIGKASLTGLGSYNYKVTAPDGSVVLSDVSTSPASMTIDLLQTGVYTVEYSTSYVDYDKSVKDLSVTVTFKVLSDKPVFLTELNKIVDMKDGGTTYTLTATDKPDLALESGDTATLTSWKVYKFHRDFVNRVNSESFGLSDQMYETEVAASELVVDNGVLTGIIPKKNYSYRIEYKISAYDESFTVNKTLFFTNTTDKMNIKDAYADFYTAGTKSGSVNSTAQNGIVLSGAGGVNSISGEYVNAVALGNLSSMTLVFYNAGEDDVYLFFHGSPETGAVRAPLKAKQYTCLDFNLTTLQAWGFVSETENGYVFGGVSGKIHRLGLRVYSPSNTLNVSLCDIWLNADAFLPVMEGISYESEYYKDSAIAVVAPTTLINVTDYTVTVTKSGETQAIYTCSKSDVENGAASFTPTETGEYTITYTGTYLLNGETKTYEKTVTFTCKQDLDDPSGEGLVTDKWTDQETLY